MTLEQRFLKYVAFDTQSDPKSETYPSTAKQLALLNHLLEEMTTLGLHDVEIDPNGYVTGTIPATPGCESAPVVGFISHVDTSPDMKGSDIRPGIIERYDGGDIALNDKLTMRAADFPELAFYKGHRLIVTDGTTLLGADDKAGIAEIMTAAEYLTTHPEAKHGTIRIGFTPDEEIAVQGRNIHPGYAKDKMINALQVACEINALLPAAQRPEHTEGYEGFYHLVGLEGTVERASLEYIIRDHSHKKFEAKKRYLADAVALLGEKYGEGVIRLTLKDQYYNMREKIEPYPEVIEKAMEAMRQAGVAPIVRPIRGGTDGARLSYMGLPCPNLFTGGMNFHGKFEYCSVDTMQRAVQTIINLARIWSES